MDNITMENGIKIKWKAMDIFNGQMEEHMKVNGKQTLCMGKVSLLTQMENNIKGNFSLTKNMAMVI